MCLALAIAEASDPGGPHWGGDRPVQTAVVERARFEARRRPTQAGPNARMATASASAISFTIEDVWPRLRHDLTVTAKEGYIRCPIWPCTRTG
jgi:hypothetical protein